MTSHIFVTYKNPVMPHRQNIIKTETCLSVGLASEIPKLIHYRVVLFHTPDSGLTDL